ncbi:vinorine synthase-like [Herrania umbratica]|uniref:Vinorine synthase-like n=1 Tax=Herrania umbratica TaxID=108875 RepID=A0A6J1B8T0_9ROSI|nr:vinorine synthase-like [Herrania umbratica]
MLNLEAQILSREIIKPSSPEIHQRKPFKICLFDQLTPFTYVSNVTFYSLSDTNFSKMDILTQLKRSLSETLNILYPYSGRIKDNMFIDRFNEGVPFLSAQINCRLSEFLKRQEIVSLNKLLPCQPFCKESNNDAPLLVCQVTMFACGGIALGLCLSHKITDAKTGLILSNVWSEVSRGISHHNIGNPTLPEASLVFPPKNPMPQNYLSMMENLWFTEANYVTRRFTFAAKAIAKLKAMAKGESEARPTRTEAVSGFIWKCSMAASRVTSGSLKPSIIVQAVNLRARGKPNSLDDSIGNVFWWASALSNPAETGTELSELVDLMKQSIAAFDDEYLSSVQGEQGFQVIAEYFNQLEMLFSFERPDIFAFTSWLNLGYYKTDFGWGLPSSLAPFGKVGPAFRNLTVFIETKCGKGIEAWITLDEERMLVLEKDPEFLKFASPCMKISSL